jgi:histidinol phosphatase-like enzyme
MVFAATSKEDVFRKPRIGMFTRFAKEAGLAPKSGVEMFFVGDAAGRIEGHATGRPKDFADTDR